MPQKKRLDESLRKELAEIINKKITQNNFLITVSRTNCAPDLSQIKIEVSILPENLTGTALKKLKPQSRRIAEELKRKVNLSRVPKIIWQTDSSTQDLFEIDEKLKQ